MGTKSTSKSGIGIQPAVPSPEVQELMGKVPGWIIRWGTMLFLIVLIIALIGSWFFRYPDVVRTTVTVTTDNPPIEVMARSEGRIQQLFVTDTQHVNKGDVLAVIENPAVYSDMEMLRRSMEQLSEEMIPDTAIIRLLPDRALNLGDIQPDHARFANDLNRYRNYLWLDYYGEKARSVKDEIKKYHVYYARLNNQKYLLERELVLARKQYRRDSILFSTHVIPPAEFERAESDLLKKNHDYEQSRVNLSEAAIHISELEQDVLDLALKNQEELDRLKNQLLESFRKLKAALAEWELKYLLTSPVSGYVSLSRYWSEGQFVTTNRPVMIIVPGQPGELMGRLQLNPRRSGKVKPRQKVLIRLENYPYLEFGMLQGVVETISLVPDEQEYVVEIRFPNGLTTNYGKVLEFRQEMTGTAEIITDVRPMLMRILEPFRHLWEKSLISREGER